MKKAIILISLALILVVAPVLISQLNQPEGRSFTGPKLDPSRFSEVSFQNREQGIDLAGMLFLPEGEGPFPAAVVIHGSGTSRRDSRWYLSLAHYLQDRGVAVLLPDKRGSVNSGGDWRNSSMQDLASDTSAAVAFLRSQNRAALSDIGVIGMSQGGWIAPIVANQPPEIDFMVSVVGAAVTAHQQLLYEENNNLRQAGFLPGISNVIAGMSTNWLRHVGQSDFWEAVGDFDPLPYWKKLSIPAVALYGANDTNVPSDRSAALLKSLGNPNIRVKIYEGSGHALEDPVGQGDDLLRKDALQDIRDFIDD